MNKGGNVTITAEFNEDELSTLVLYLKEQDKELQALLTNAIAIEFKQLYQKNVPVAVRGYIALKNGSAPPEQKRQRRRSPPKEKPDMD